MLQEANSGIWFRLTEFLCFMLDQLRYNQIYYVFFITDLGLEARCTTSALTTDLSPEE